MRIEEALDKIKEQSVSREVFGVEVIPFSFGKEKSFRESYLDNRKQELILLKEELERLK